MYIELIASTSVGKDGHGARHIGLVHWDGESSIGEIAREVSMHGLQSLVFVDGETFADSTRAMDMCREMRAVDMNVLWSATLTSLPASDLLKEMRMAGCQRLEMYLGPEEAVDALMAAREFGFDICIRNVDGTPYASESTQYSLEEREAISARLPELHSAQLDLAVAYFNARRFRDVMLPLGKAMTLGFPVNELCLNLLACLSAAKHYPDMAAGLLTQAQYGAPHPVVSRNTQKLRSWLESGGDIKGVRLMLQPEHSPMRMIA